MVRSLGFRIALLVVGLSALAFGIFTGFSQGWQLDIVNTVTIAAALVLIVSAIFVKTSGAERRSVQSRHV